MDTLREVLTVAIDLASEDGENVEYDRALVELVANLMPGDPDTNRAWAEDQILATRH